MKTYIFFAMCLMALGYILNKRRQRPSYRWRSIDAIVPAFNEEPCIKPSLLMLLTNPYINRVICVNDGSTDGTANVLAKIARSHGRLMVVNQANTGKGGAVMHGLLHAHSKYVFLTDADTFVPPESDGLGYMIAEMERGADAVGGIPSSNLAGARLLPYVRATVKLPMIVLKRTFQQILGGSPFIVSGACGLFRADVLRHVGLSDRTKVEDLDLTWTLKGMGYTVRQANRCIVYSQECNDVREEWLRWRRWIIGYAICMRLHWRLLPTRFGLFSMLPMFLFVAFGIGVYASSWTQSLVGGDAHVIPLSLFPLTWVAAVLAIGSVSAFHHRKLRLVAFAPLAVFYVLLSYAIWIVHGLKGLITGCEPARDKPTRYANVVA